MTQAAGEVQEAAGMQLADTYIGCRQGMVDKWVALLPIFEVFSRKNDYEDVCVEGTLGGDRRHQNIISGQPWGGKVEQ